MEMCKSPIGFSYRRQDFVERVHRSIMRRDDGVDRATIPMPSIFDTALRAGWTDRMGRGLFRYHLGELQTRVLPGPSGYVAQLNIQRGIERRKPQEILSIKQPFDAKQFNFNKINPEEILFEMSKQHEVTATQEDPCIENGKARELCKMIVLINVSPLEFGHCLLVPEPTHCSPQVLTPFAIQTGIESVLLSSEPGFRVGFNSLGAFASVNHLHLHGYYMDHQLHVECAAARPLVPEKGFFRMTAFPNGFLFYTEIEDLEKVARTICQVTDFMVGGNKAHNLFFTRGCPPGETHEQSSSRCGVRVIVWPRVSSFGAKEESGFNVALCELAGHLPFKNQKDYDNSTEKDVMSIIQRYLLPDEEFLQLEKQLVAHLQYDL